MSEFTQVDLQIGTEAQFETKKADLSEGVIVGLTDPIHENELDSDLQTKLDSIKKMYLHDITLTVPGLNTTQHSTTLYISVVTSKTTAYDTASFQTEVAKEQGLSFLARASVFGSGLGTGVYGVIEFSTFYAGSYKCYTNGNIPYLSGGIVNLLDMGTENQDYSITADTVIEL